MKDQSSIVKHEMLKSLFYLLCEKVEHPGKGQIDQNLIQQAWEEIHHRYGEKHRAYHTLDHISALIDLILHSCTSHNTLSQTFKNLCFAAFYHDLIYNPLRKDNEAKSAEIASKRLASLGLSGEDIGKISDIIHRTAGHLTAGADADTLFFLDADLSILGSGPEEYFNYTRQIRKEYKMIPKLLYNPGRKKILQDFLQRKSIYFTPFFRKKLEKQARENMAAELETL